MSTFGQKGNQAGKSFPVNAIPVLAAVNQQKAALPIDVNLISRASKSARPQTSPPSPSGCRQTKPGDSPAAPQARGRGFTGLRLLPHDP
jgi:hypothetical protein